MNRWIGVNDREEWAALFTTFQRTAFRWEAQQSYSKPTEDAALARFRAGEPFDSTVLEKTVSRLRELTDRGCTQSRVRVVVEPPNDYTRLELEVYKHLAAAGEDIRILATSSADAPEELPAYDFWLFDDRIIWRMHYHDDHTFRGAELIDNAGAVEQHARWRDIAVERSVSLHDYVSESKARR